jgi:hypothetical protein
MASRTLVCLGLFARSHYTPRDVAVGDQANWFQALLACVLKAGGVEEEGKRSIGRVEAASVAA